MLVLDYTCQNTTLLEITCRGSIMSLHCTVSILDFLNNKLLINFKLLDLSNFFNAQVNRIIKLRHAQVCPLSEIKNLLCARKVHD